MKINNCILVLLMLLSLQSQSQKKEIKASSDKPNVLIIFPDQLRRYSAGFWSEPEYSKYVIGKPDPVYTPNIDKLAKKRCSIY